MACTAIETSPWPVTRITGSSASCVTADAKSTQFLFGGVDGRMYRGSMSRRGLMRDVRCVANWRSKTRERCRDKQEFRNRPIIPPSNGSAPQRREIVTYLGASRVEIRASPYPTSEIEASIETEQLLSTSMSTGLPDWPHCDAAVHRAHHAMNAHSAVFDRNLSHLCDETFKRRMHGDAAPMSLG